jgi:hypothetical protein
MPAIFDAPNVKKVPVRDFDAKRVISLHWNEDVADDRLDRVVAFATTHNGYHPIGKTSKLLIDYPVASPSLNPLVDNTVAPDLAWAIN